MQLLRQLSFILYAITLSSTALAYPKLLFKKSNIALFQNDNQCFFFMTGVDSQNKVIDSVIWLPNTANKFYVSTTETDYLPVLSEYELFNQMLLKGYRKRWSKHFLIADNNKESYVELSGLSDGQRTANIFEANFKHSLLPLLKREKPFVINLKTKNNKAHLRTHFALNDFNTVYSHYKQHCAI